MKFYGWIPHLRVDLKMKYTEEAFLQKLKKIEKIEKTSSDIPQSEKLTITFEPPKSFTYNKTEIITTVINGNYKYNLKTIVKSSGLIVIELLFNDNKELIQLMPNSPRLKDSNTIHKLSSERDFESLSKDDEEVKAIKDTIREVYFSLKNTYHSDIHHKTGPENADDQLSVYFAKDETEAIKEICSAFLRLCENNLEKPLVDFIDIHVPRYKLIKKFQLKRLTLKGKTNFNTRYKLTSGFIAYGSNFINIFKGTLRKDFYTYRESLKSCSESLESLQTHYCNDLSHDDNKKMEKLTLSIIALTILIAAVSLISLFYTMALNYFPPPTTPDIEEIINTSDLFRIR